MYPTRLPPQDAEAEEAVIGSLLIDGAGLIKAAPLIKPNDFSTERMKACYEACLALFDRGEAINQVTLAAELENKGVLESVGGALYLSQLVVKVPTSAHIEHYARIVHRVSIMRQLVEAADSIATIGYEGGPDVDGALTSAEDLLFRLRMGEGSRDFVHLSGVLSQYLEEKQLSDSHRPDAPSLSRQDIMI